MTHPANKLSNLRRRVNRARRFPTNTCPASRHLHTMADALARRGDYPMLRDEPEHCAGSIYAVLEALWKARTRLAQLEPTEAVAENVGDRITFAKRRRRA